MVSSSEATLLWLGHIVLFDTCFIIAGHENLGMYWDNKQLMAWSIILIISGLLANQLCSMWRMDAMSLLVDCIFQAISGETHTFCCDSIYYTHVLWLLTWSILCTGCVTLIIFLIVRILVYTGWFKNTLHSPFDVI